MKKSKSSQTHVEGEFLDLAYEIRERLREIDQKLNYLIENYRKFNFTKSDLNCDDNSIKH